MRVLLTDDSKTIRMVLRDVLTQLGYTDVLEAENGAKALEIVAQGGVEVLLLDLHMPVLDGLGTLKQLKSDPKTASIPVVIISSDTDMRVIDQARQLGAIGYIKKPFKADAMQKALAVALETQRRASASGRQTTGTSENPAVDAGDAKPVDSKPENKSWMKRILG